LSGLIVGLIIVGSSTGSSTLTFSKIDLTRVVAAGSIYQELRTYYREEKSESKDIFIIKLIK
jgi:hypothetical protein